MKKGIYIYYNSKRQFLGVEKKIKNQIKALSEHFDMSEVIVEKDSSNLFKSICWRLPGGSFGANYAKAVEDIHSISGDEKDVAFFYIRKNPLDRKNMGFLSSIRESYPNSKILMELPTYPYDKEYITNKTLWPWFFKDRLYRLKIRKYIDRIVTFDEYDEIFGIPTIKAMNGIDVTSVKQITKSNEDINTIRIIIVATMIPYHACERVISGVSTYYKNGGKRNIEVLMVGYGPELDYYKRLTRKLGVEDRIIYKGKLDGKELDDIYEGCDIGVGAMGGYKIGVDRIVSIKLGEYLAKGIPVIVTFGTYLLDVMGNNYVLGFPNDKTEIDMNKVVEFYDNLYAGKDKGEVRNRIRQRALECIDITKSMENVVSYLVGSQK